MSCRGASGLLSFRAERGIYSRLDLLPRAPPEKIPRFARDDIRVALKRELAAAVAIPIVLAVLFYAPTIAFDLLVTLVALAALWEFYRLAEKTGSPPAKTVGIAAGAGALCVGSILWSRPELQLGSTYL